MSKQKSNQEATLILFAKILNLQIELAAMSHVFIASRIYEPVTGRELNWRETVAEYRDLLNSTVQVEKYSKVQGELHSLAPEIPELLQLLTKFVDQPVTPYVPPHK